MGAGLGCSLGTGDQNGLRALRCPVLPVLPSNPQFLLGHSDSSNTGPKGAGREWIRRAPGMPGQSTQLRTRLRRGGGTFPASAAQGGAVPVLPRAEGGEERCGTAGTALPLARPLLPGRSPLPAVRNMDRLSGEGTERAGGRGWGSVRVVTCGWDAGVGREGERGMSARCARRESGGPGIGFPRRCRGTEHPELPGWNGMGRDLLLSGA